MSATAKTNLFSAIFRGKGGRLTIFWVALLAVLPYLPSLGYGFLIEWDDGSFIVHNPRMILSWENLAHCLTGNLQGTYLPLTSLWYLVDNAVFRGNPAGFHLVNVLLFAGICAFFFLILRRLRLPAVVAAAVVLLWAWNPCKIEEVAWIAERKGLASSFFAFWAMWWFMRDCRRNRLTPGPAALTFVGCMFKPWVLPLPGVMVLYAWMRSPHNFRRIFRWSLPPVLAGILAAVLVSVMTFGGTSVPHPFAWVDIAGIFRYIGAALIPLSLNPLYPVSGFSDIGYELIWGGIVLAGLWAVSIAAFGRKFGCRLSLAFTAAVAGVALPVLSSGCFTNTNYTDRYGFLISAVLWSWGGIACLRFYRRFPRPFALGAGVLAAGYLLAGTIYSETFSDAALLFARAASEENCPAKAIDGLALVGLNRNRPELVAESGEFYLRRASRQSGNKRLYYETTGTLLRFLAPAMRGEPGAGIRLGRVVERINPTAVYSPTSFLARACGLAAGSRLESGDRSGAVRLLELQLEQKAGDAYQLGFASGLLGYLTGDWNRSVAGWKQALKAKPGDERALRNLREAEKKAATDGKTVLPSTPRSPAGDGARP